MDSSSLFLCSVGAKTSSKLIFDQVKPAPSGQG
jgi:hypothetical protein